jgi:WD40 repeat protein/serine/threonine protein kinase
MKTDARIPGPITVGALEPAAAAGSITTLLDVQSACWARGERVALEDLLRQLPSALGETDVALDLIHHEVILRHGAGESPEPCEYLGRFPYLSRQIERMFEVERYVRRDTDGPGCGCSVTSSIAGAVGRDFEVSPLPVVAGYAIEGVLGRGGMGVVYRARHLRLNRPVALKMILAEAHADPDVMARFRAEADAVAQVQHPNIVQIYDVGESAGRPYLTFELVEGKSLAARAAGAPQPVRDVARLVEKLARAIHHAHGRGVIHRDLKPANILMTADGEPKITDFGLAKRLFGGQCQTGSISIIGTPSYMAPEQASGRSRQVGVSTDVYGLGAIMYELLTGRPPFKGETPLETLQQVTTMFVVPPGRLVPSVPRDLETICLKCLEKEPGRRFASAELLVDELARFLRGDPIRSRRTPRWERALKWACVRPAVATLSAACVLVSIVGLAAVLWQWRHANAAYRETAGALSLVERHLYRHRAALAERAQSSGQVRLADQILEECPPEQRGWEWQYLKGLRFDGPAPLRHASQLFSVRFSPDGNVLAVGQHSGEVTIWDAQTWNTLRTFRAHSRWARCVAFSPDGTRLATAGWDGNVSVWDPTTGARVWTGRHDENVNAVAFSRDGRFVVSGGTGSAPIQVWDARVGERLRQLAGHESQVLAVAFSPDGTLLASGSADRSIKLWDVAAWRELDTLPDHSAQVMGLAFSPDGRRLAAACGGFYEDEPRGELTIWSVQKRQVVHSLGQGAGGTFCAAFSPDGSRLVAGGSIDPTIRIWDPESGLEVLALRGHSDAIWGLAFSPDGRRLVSASGDHTVRVWDGTPSRLRSSPEKLTIGPLADAAIAVSIAPNGDALALGCRDGTITIHDLSTGRRRHALYCAGVSRLAFSRDGQFLAAGSTKGKPQLWNAGSWTQLPVQPFDEVVLDVAFLGTNRGLALTNGNTIDVQDLTSNGVRPRLTLRGHADYLLTISAHPHDRALASAGYDGMIRIWSLENANVIHAIPAHQGRVTCVTFSPDGRRLLSAGNDGAFRMWDTTTWRRLWNGHEPDGLPQRIAFSPDGRKFASASTGAALRIWEADDGRCIRTLRGHADSIKDIAFSPDGHTLASASLDRTVKLWSAP